jgi:hypothetical protein
MPDCPQFKKIENTSSEKFLLLPTSIGGLSADQARTVRESRRKQKSSDFK